MVRGFYPREPRPTGGIQRRRRHRLREPLQRPRPPHAGRPAGPRAVRTVGGVRRPAHLYILFERRPDLYRRKGQRHRLRHHRRGLRLCVPADVPSRNKFSLCRGVFRPREQCRRAGRADARKCAGRLCPRASAAGVPPLHSRRDLPFQADAARRDALRRGVLQQHPGHLRPDQRLHPLQRQLLPLQLDVRRPLPSPGRLRGAD